MLDAIHDRRPLIPTMAEIKAAVQDSRIDARNLWLPVTAVLASLAIICGAVWWAATLNTRVMILSETLGRIEQNVETAAESARRLEAHDREIIELQSKMATWEDNWTIDTRNMHRRMDRITDAVEREHQIQIEEGR